MEPTELEVQYDDWHAVHDHMGKTLRVYGNCTIPSGGFAASLQPRDEQGVNPRSLLINLRFAPTGESPVNQALEYEQAWNDDGIQYEEVAAVVVGDISAPAPDALPVEDAY